MEIRTTTEDPIQIHDDLEFVTSEDVTDQERYNPAYVIEGAENHVIGIEANTPVAPEFYDSNGDKMDESTRVIMQKADPQGNALGNAIIHEANLGQYDYEKFRSDPEYFKYTRKPLLLDEREFLHVYLDIPNGSNGFDAGLSRLTIGDNVTQTGKPVFIREKSDLTAAQREAVAQASTGGN